MTLKETNMPGLKNGSDGTVIYYPKWEKETRWNEEKRRMEHRHIDRNGYFNEGEWSLWQPMFIRSKYVCPLCGAPVDHTIAPTFPARHKYRCYNPECPYEKAIVESYPDPIELKEEE